jgi:hypothetical protein
MVINDGVDDCDNGNDDMIINIDATNHYYKLAKLWQSGQARATEQVGDDGEPAVSAFSSEMMTK